MQNVVLEDDDINLTTTESTKWFSITFSQAVELLTKGVWPHTCERILAY